MVSSWEDGRVKMPKLSELNKICGYFNVLPEALLFRDMNCTTIEEEIKSVERRAVELIREINIKTNMINSEFRSIEQRLNQLAGSLAVKNLASTVSITNLSHHGS